MIGIWEKRQQEITSANTCVGYGNSGKLPRTITRVQWVSGTRNADIGGGKYDNVTEYLAKRGVTSFVYDPYNRSVMHNHDVQLQIVNGQCDTVTVNNVLNVIKEAENRQQVIEQAYNCLKCGGEAYFCMYAGDKTGIGKETRSGWQNNRVTQWYLGEISHTFGNWEIKDDIISAVRDQIPQILDF